MRGDARNSVQNEGSERASVHRYPPSALEHPYVSPHPGSFALAQDEVVVQVAFLLNIQGRLGEIAYLYGALKESV